jgi:hypothetical protein
MEPQIELKGLLGGSQAARETFVNSTPLAACVWPAVLAAILPSHPRFNAKPAPGGEVGYVLKVAVPLAELWFRLPALLEYRALRITGIAPVIGFEIETATRTVVTNMQELGQKLALGAARTEREWEAAFAGLCNAFVAPVSRPALLPFISRVVGEVAPDQYECWRAAPLALPYWDGVALPVVMGSSIVPGDVAAVDNALENFLRLGSEARDAASARVLAECHAFLGLVGADDDERREMAAIIDPREIWKHVACEEILIDRDDAGGEPVIYVALLCSCDWDVEHGLQLVCRNGEILSRVGSQDGSVV